ncbi:MAG: glycoside hydrolase family 88 protein, partial [Ruminococcus sp.]|nr:glycoside hydrolase family 88 protein [Ruminococcus sp.]
MTDIGVIEQTAHEYIKKFVLTSEPLNPRWNCENYIFGKKPKWNYIDNCMVRALLMFDKPEYTRYAIDFMDSYIDSSGVIATMRASDYNLDNVCGGMNLIQLYRISGIRHYKLAYEKIYNEQLANQPRLKCGNFWHKAIYPQQLWLDGAYMALPFLALYGKINGNDSIVEDAVSQMLNIRRFMLDKKSGLYYHGYNESREMFWSDKKTGLSPEIWLRSDGWLCAGLADLYEITADDRIGEMLRELIHALCS